MPKFRKGPTSLSSDDDEYRDFPELHTKWMSQEKSVTEMEPFSEVSVINFCTL